MSFSLPEWRRLCTAIKSAEDKITATFEDHALHQVPFEIQQQVLLYIPSLSIFSFVVEHHKIEASEYTLRRVFGKHVCEPIEYVPKEHLRWATRFCYVGHDEAAVGWLERMGRVANISMTK
jgi:hypothetical protein